MSTFKTSMKYISVAAIVGGLIATPKIIEGIKVIGVYVQVPEAAAENAASIKELSEKVDQVPLIAQQVEQIEKKTDDIRTEQTQQRQILYQILGKLNNAQNEFSKAFPTPPTNPTPDS